MIFKYIQIFLIKKINFQNYFIFYFNFVDCHVAKIMPNQLGYGVRDLLKKIKLQRYFQILIFLQRRKPKLIIFIWTKNIFKHTLIVVLRMVGNFTVMKIKQSSTFDQENPIFFVFILTINYHFKNINFFHLIRET